MAEDPKQYAKLANEGILLGYPVKIGGQEHRPDNGIGYHSTIKYFDREKDHPHAIHNLAQHLPLNPPDAKNTQIKFDKFKDRTGNDVHVVTLHGNSADKLKEHNGKFAGMGFPSTFEWTPHVSVDKPTWDRLQNSGAKTAHEAGIEFGNAELKRGPKTIKTYHHKPDTTEPLVPDESDMTAKIKVPITKSEKLRPLMKPFVSEAQRRWGHTAAGKEALGGEAGVHEWDEATKGKKLPEHVSKSEGSSSPKFEEHKDHPLPKNVKAAALAHHKKNPGSIHSVETEQDGSHWLHLNGHTIDNPGQHSWSSEKPEGLLNDIKRIKPCTCGECKKSESAIKSLIKTDHSLHKFGKALALTGETFKKYIEDHKDLQKILKEK